VNSWDLGALELEPRLPEILTSGEAGRAIVLDLAAGESLADHEVHERAWLLVISGEAQIGATAGESISGGPGLLAEFAPGERHEVTATADARLLLLLTPWPGDGHPGAMTIEQKHDVRRQAAERNE
jgi:quercetin dioxygenase-like cupin family protein